MTDIDWSKAPEDATHAFVHAGNFLGWRKLINGEWQTFTELRRWSSTVEPMDQFYVPRPLAPTWDGEGLPPVSVMVEAYFPTDSKPTWLPTILLYFSAENVIYSGDEAGEEIHRSRADFNDLRVKFRPIRTAEQIAAETRKIAIWKMACDCGYGHNEDHGYDVSPIFAAAYDKGYRKVQP